MSPLENINCVGWESIQVYWKKKKTKKVTKKTKKKERKNKTKKNGQDNENISIERRETWIGTIIY